MKRCIKEVGLGLLVEEEAIMTNTQKFAQSATVVIIGLVVFGAGILVAFAG